MDKKIITKILKNERVTLAELNSFISSYVFNQKETNVSTEQLQKITMLIQSGMFDLRFAALQAAQKVGLKVSVLKDPFDNYIKTFVQ